MHPTTRLAALAVLSAALVPAPRLAQAETYHTCTGFIDSLPATISTQGIWCLRKDLNTGMTSGAAITIAANNVTIDCNHFKLGGLAAGDATRTIGIKGHVFNATVRHCKVRGFLMGTQLSGGGHVVADSDFDNNTDTGIWVSGDGALVRGNRINDTGGSTAPGHTHAYGIRLDLSHGGAVVDNFVQGVYATPGGNGSAWGVLSYIVRGEVARNTISGLEADGSGLVHGVASFVTPSRAVFHHNTISVGRSAAMAGDGIWCYGVIARDNTVSGFATGYRECVDAGGNFAN